MLSFEQLYEHALVLEVKASKANIAQFRKKYELGEYSSSLVRKVYISRIHKMLSI